ncbi:MAG: hypothetical protein WCF18_23500 [Chthoniobacteraceae bacterium]
MFILTDRLKANQRLGSGGQHLIMKKSSSQGGSDPLMGGARLRNQAKHHMNPHIAALLKIARAYAAQIRHAVPRSRVLVGGSLRSAMAVSGKNDIDLRVLLPTGHDSPQDMAEASRRVGCVISFERILATEDLPLAYHHSEPIDVPGIGKATVEVNIQPARGYFGLAAKSARLPASLRHRSVILKGQALDARSKEKYQGVKSRWAKFIRSLADQHYFSKPPRDRIALLERARTKFPEFFTDPPYAVGL